MKSILSLIEKFIEDKNEKVRFYLIEKIGEIVKACPKNSLPEKLFKFYIKEIEEFYSDKDNLIINSIEEENQNIKKINFYFSKNDKIKRLNHQHLEV